MPGAGAALTSRSAARSASDGSHRAASTLAAVPAIVAAGGAYFDIGSDYGGSIRGPAYANGIAGIKPTYGLVPRTGHIVDYGGPFDNFQETGPMARR